jgi:hypothetical protein
MQTKTVVVFGEVEQQAPRRLGIEDFVSNEYVLDGLSFLANSLTTRKMANKTVITVRIFTTTMFLPGTGRCIPVLPVQWPPWTQ